MATSTTARDLAPSRTYTGLTSRRSAFLLLGGLWLVLFCASLFSPPLLDDADATHASAARHILESGDWVTLRVDGVRYLEKAPLPYWITAISFRLFGFNTFAAHLPLALGVLLLALLGYHWANRAFDRRAALYTGLFTLTSTGVFLFTRIFIPEVLLSLFLLIALYAFLRALEANAPPAFAYIVPTALACAVITKGLVAMVFFLGTVVVYLALTGEYRLGRRLHPIPGTFLFLILAAPWHILAGLRNRGGMDGHGFLWFYFVNEHFLRFLGKRIPMDYNKLPTALYWSLHLVWLFPWSLFCGLLLWQAIAGFQRYNNANPLAADQISYWQPFAVVVVGLALRDTVHVPYFFTVAIALVFFLVQALRLRQSSAPTATPLLQAQTFAERSTLLLTLYSAIVLIFFSISTNQEYYTFPAYLPLLLLTAAALVRAEQSTDIALHRCITFAHAAFTIIGLAVAAALGYGLWTARHLPFVADIGDLLAHRAVGNYTLSMSHFFDLTGPSFAALRLPTVLAAIALALGPALAWILRAKRHHFVATLTITFTSAIFLIAAHLAFVRFAPMLSSQNMAAKIDQLEHDHRISRDNQVLLYGDQSYGSSIPFYLHRSVKLVDGRSTSLLFGSTFPDTPPIFLTPADLLAQWGNGPRKILFVPLERRAEVDHLLGPHQLLLEETSGKALLTDRPLDRTSNP